MELRMQYQRKALKEQEIYNLLKWDPETLKENAEPLINHHLKNKEEETIDELVEINLSEDMHRPQGSNSKIFRLDIKAKRKGSGIVTGDLLFFIKKCFAGYEEERAFLTVAKEQIPEKDYSKSGSALIGTLKLFPDLLNSGYEDSKLHANSEEFTSRKIFLLEAITHESLDERFERLERPSHKDAEQYLDPLILLNEVLTKKEDEILAEMGGREILSMTEKLYMAKLLNAASTLSGEDYTKGERKISLTRAFKEIAYPLFNIDGKALSDLDLQKKPHFSMETLISKTMWPFHDMAKAVIDPAKIVKGHRAYQLGCLFGHPSVYNKFENPHYSMKELGKTYLWKAERFSGYDFGEPRFREKLVKEFVDMIMISAILGGMDSAEARKKYDKSWLLAGYHESVKHQCNYFDKGGKGQRLWNELNPIFAKYIGRPKPHSSFNGGYPNLTKNIDQQTGGNAGGNYSETDNGGEEGEEIITLPDEY